MATTVYYEADLYPVSDKGKADTSKSPTNLEFYISNFFDDHQIYLRISDEADNGTQLHLTKKQAMELAESLERAVLSIGYDNT